MRTDLAAIVRDHGGSPALTPVTLIDPRAGEVLVRAHDVPAAAAAPLGCAVLTGVGTVLNVLAPRHGDDILILGAGAVGLSAVMAAKASGCRSILVSDPIEARRLLALELGATAAVAPEQIDALLADLGAVRLALDTVGTQDTIDTALAALAPRGTCATIALRPGSNRLTVAQSRLLWGRTVTGVIEGDAVLARDIPRLVAMWRAGRLPVEKLVTVYDFDDVARAIADTRSGAVVKAVLVRDGGAHEPAPPSDACSSGCSGTASASARTRMSTRSCAGGATASWSPTQSSPAGERRCIGSSTTAS